VAVAAAGPPTEADAPAEADAAAGADAATGDPLTATELPPDDHESGR